jgi:protein gp37
MGETSAIEWTDSTWNPWRGCDKISPGCAHCYMFTAQERYGRDPGVVTRCAPGTFYAPLRSRKWAQERDACIARKGSHLVFTCSWSDWFHEDADAWRDEAWEIIRQTPESTYQILTKRPERILDCLPDWWGITDHLAPANVWLGVTIENRRFIERAELLRDVPANVRFISAEPLLGPLMIYEERQAGIAPAWDWSQSLDLHDIDWLITGGESGPKHRRFDPAWAIDLRDACELHGVAFLHKQNGGATSKSNGRLLSGRTHDGLPAVRA